MSRDFPSGSSFVSCAALSLAVSWTRTPTAGGWPGGGSRNPSLSPHRPTQPVCWFVTQHVAPIHQASMETCPDPFPTVVSGWTTTKGGRKPGSNLPGGDREREARRNRWRKTQKEHRKDPKRIEIFGKGRMGGPHNSCTVKQMHPRTRGERNPNAGCICSMVQLLGDPSRVPPRRGRGSGSPPSVLPPLCSPIFFPVGLSFLFYLSIFLGWVGGWVQPANLLQTSRSFSSARWVAHTPVLSRIEPPKGIEKRVFYTLPSLRIGGGGTQPKHHVVWW